VSSPKLVVIVTAVLFAAHAVVLTTLGTGGRGPLLSNSLQLALGIICVIAPLVAARGGAAGLAFGRRFLYLMSGRYLIWAAAQGLSIIVPENDAPYQESVANVLFHLEDLPMGVALLLDVPVDADRATQVRIGDLGQMAVFLGAVVLYSIYSPTSPASGVGLLPSTDAIIATGFYARALLTRSPVAGALFGRFTPFILLSAINHS